MLYLGHAVSYECVGICSPRITYSISAYQLLTVGEAFIFVRQTCVGDTAEHVFFFFFKQDKTYHSRDIKTQMIHNCITVIHLRNPL